MNPVTFGIRVYCEYLLPEGRTFEMYTVHTGGRKAGREVVVVEMKGRFVGGASLSFIQWMARRVPSQQLRPEQQALVKWYEEHSDHEAA